MGKRRERDKKAELSVVENERRGSEKMDAHLFFFSSSAGIHVLENGVQVRRGSHC